MMNWFGIEELVWYRGTVLKMLETKEFEVQYDEEEDIYTFALLDIKNGDLLMVT